MSPNNTKLDTEINELKSKLNNKNIVFFDLETQNLFVELEHRWNNMKWKEKQKIKIDLCRKMKVSIAGLLYFENNEVNYQYYNEGDIEQLERDLLSADKIIGHNLLNFDYDVLFPYIPETSLDQIKEKTIDLMILMSDKTDQWLSLDDLGKLNFNVGKTVNTLDIPKMWRNGKHEEVRKYLKNDLDLLAGVFNYGLNEKSLKYYVKDYGKLVGQKYTKFNWNRHIR